MSVMVSIPDSLYARMVTTIPQRQRSKVIAKLLEDAIKKGEQQLYNAALAVEQDEELRSIGSNYARRDTTGRNLGG